MPPSNACLISITSQQLQQCIKNTIVKIQLIILCNTKFVYCVFFIDLDVFFAADFENAIIFSLSSVLF